MFFEMPATSPTAMVSGKLPLQHSRALNGDLCTDMASHGELKHISCHSKGSHAVAQPQRQYLNKILQLGHVPSHTALRRVDSHRREAPADAESSTRLRGVTCCHAPEHRSPQVHLRKWQGTQEPANLKLDRLRQFLAHHRRL